MRFNHLRRRDFIRLVGGTAFAWPLAARAQRPDRVRRIGALHGVAATDPDAQSNMTTFVQSLQNLGWTIGRNVVIDYRWAAGDIVGTRVFAKELLSLVPDVILASGTGPVAALREETRTVPIVFARVSEPIELGVIASLGRPGGNMTGFSNFEFAMGGKWLQTLKELAPDIRRVVVIANPEASPLDGYFRSIAAASGSLAVEPVRASVHNLDDIERAIAVAGDKPGGGLIFVPDSLTIINRAAVVAQAMRRLVPAIYPFRFFAAEGGLVSYGINTNEQYRGAATYVDRILKGEKPGDLPVQAPTKFELVINLKTAKALGLTVRQEFLLLADEVIE